MRECERCHRKTHVFMHHVDNYFESLMWENSSDWMKMHYHLFYVISRNSMMFLHLFFSILFGTSLHNNILNSRWFSTFKCFKSYFQYSRTFWIYLPEYFMTCFNTQDTLGLSIILQARALPACNVLMSTVFIMTHHI